MGSFAKRPNLEWTFLSATLAVALFISCGPQTTGSPAPATPLSRTDAERRALANVRDGAVRQGELETEEGRLVWSFDIASPGTADITEVKIDAVTGAVVSIEHETLRQQAAEAEQDRSEKPRH